MPVVVVVVVAVVVVVVVEEVEVENFFDVELKKFFFCYV